MSLPGPKDRRGPEALLDGLEKGAVVIADKGYDADRVRARIRAQEAFERYLKSGSGHAFANKRLW
jgi:IS5 family transposase